MKLMMKPVARPNPTIVEEGEEEEEGTKSQVWFFSQQKRLLQTHIGLLPLQGTWVWTCTLHPHSLTSSSPTHHHHHQNPHHYPSLLLHAPAKATPFPFPSLHSPQPHSPTFAASSHSPHAPSRSSFSAPTLTPPLPPETPATGTATLSLSTRGTSAIGSAPWRSFVGFLLAKVGAFIKPRKTLVPTSGAAALFTSSEGWMWTGFGLEHRWMGHAEWGSWGYHTWILEMLRWGFCSIFCWWLVTSSVWHDMFVSVLLL